MTGHGRHIEIQANGYRTQPLGGEGPKAPPRVERRKVRQRLRRRVTLRLAAKWRKRRIEGEVRDG